MSNICARCEKVVYPMEELRALDKIYHKNCFRCTECGCTLNLKNYKGYTKMPYCNAHYPKDKASVVIDTPANVTAMHNTRMQSNLNYHKDFEKQKGTGAGGVSRHAPGEEGAPAETAAAAE
ncbi:unnamed protein product [Gordionus sp. m RMFG-2023]|uniref:LIM and SH3 domain protein F42H10.3-like n=1 Tax=Gordionus sp. m RMFG-2023 TaxID=3053472 RepID=UPI0030E425C1